MLAVYVVVPQSDGVKPTECGVASSKHHQGTTMNYYAGIDVSLEASSVCIIDATGKIVREGKVASEPEALIAWFKSVGVSLARIGLEAGPLSRWLYAAMRQKENDRRAFGAVMTPAFPKRGPDAGTMDQVRPHCAAWHHTTLTVDWPTYPLQAPSGGGLAPTPDRSKTPAKGFLASGEEGLTNQGPLQKGAISAEHCAASLFANVARLSHENGAMRGVHHRAGQRPDPAANPPYALKVLAAKPA